MINRLLRHVFTGPLAVRRRLDTAALERISQAVAAEERRHGGEIRVALEASLAPGQILGGVTVRTRAVDVFSRLRVWDTEANNGVLIYLLMADRQVEIVADRGATTHIGEASWTAVSRQLEDRLKKGEFELGIIEAVRATSALLLPHFPSLGDNPNELPDRPAVL